MCTHEYTWWKCNNQLHSENLSLIQLHHWPNGVILIHVLIQFQFDLTGHTPGHNEMSIIADIPISGYTWYVTIQLCEAQITAPVTPLPK